ncbi:G protein-regulated inducer of neurite outgrowth 2 [Gastrophryne carolinensis]
MAEDIHGVSTDQIPNLNCHEKNTPVCYSLSKSSSLLFCGTLGDTLAKAEIHKSLNSIPILPTCGQNNRHSPYGSNLSSTQNAKAIHFPVESNDDHLSVDKVEDKIQMKNHYLSADSSLAATEPEITQNFARYNVLENISLLGSSEMSLYEGEHTEQLDIPNMVVQKSYSDYCCGHRNSVPYSLKLHNKNSATYSSLSSSSSISRSGSDRNCNLSSITQDSGIVYSPSNVQNHITDAIYTDTDHNIPLCNMNDGNIQSDITVCVAPGTYHHVILEPRNSGNDLLRTGNVYSQSQYILKAYENVSEVRHCLPPLNFHNSCSTECSKVHEPRAKVDDTIAAYCHPMPIPSLQFSAGERGLLHTQSQLSSLLTISDTIAFPKLVSSVSESGLDTKKLLRCGQLTFPQTLISGAEPDVDISVMGNGDLLLKTLGSIHDGLEPPGMSAKMKDNWTMTSISFISTDHKYLPSCKDAEVQTVVIMENKSVSPIPCLQATLNSHLYPQHGSTFNLQCPKSPIREVRWDNEGMTWEVYGAAMDPEVLGLAIQKHLDIQIEQHVQPSELSGEMDQPAKEKRRSFRTVIQSLGQSNCCVRASSTSD